MSNRKLEPEKLVIATHNAGKLREIRALLEPYGIEAISAGDLNLPEPEETGVTFEENALIKAHASAKASGLPALSDDSGLCVAALDGAPGVYTADWAEMSAFECNGDEKTGDRNWYMAMGKVEGKLAAMAAEGKDIDRSAYFACTLALAWPDGHEEIFEGRVTGSLTWPPRGNLGFGYDPVFVPDGYTQSFAEIAPSEKHGISHRADAFKKMVATSLPPPN